MDESTILDKFKEAKSIMKTIGLKKNDDQIPQISWILLLKIIDDYDKKRQDEPNFQPLIPKPYRWQDWTSQIKLTDQPLIDFVTTDLFPKLRNLPIEPGFEFRQIINSIFRNVNNRIPKGIPLREIIDLFVNKKDEKNTEKIIDFADITTVRTFSKVYEKQLEEMRNDAGKSAIFYTPSAVVEFIVSYIKPNFRKNETIFDPAFGLGGFLLESFKQMKPYEKESSDVVTLREKTLFGVEKEGEHFLCMVVRMMLNDLDKLNVVLDNSLHKDTKIIPEKNHYDIIMTNPTYGGHENKSIKDNLPHKMKGASTEMHFLYYVMQSVKDGGRGAMIVPNGILFAGDDAALYAKGKLFSDFNVHTIIRLPKSMFQPYNTVETNILFFEKSGPTKEIWFYEMPIREGIKGYGKKTLPETRDFEPVLQWMKNKEENDIAWKIKVSELKDFNLVIANPNKKEPTIDLSPHELIQQIISDEKKTLSLLEDVENLINTEIPK